MIAFRALKVPFAPTLGQLGFSFVAEPASPIRALARREQRQQIGKLELGYLRARRGTGARLGGGLASVSGKQRPRLCLVACANLEPLRQAQCCIALGSVQHAIKRA
jgi:hypothetical protein